MLVCFALTDARTARAQNDADTQSLISRVKRSALSPSAGPATRSTTAMNSPCRSLDSLRSLGMTAQLSSTLAP